MKYILPIIIGSIVFAGCSNKLYLSSWHKQSVKDKNFRFYHSDSKIRYNVENDDEFLYFSFDVLDQLTIQKILTTGLRLHLDPSGKNKQKHEAQFPIYSDKVPVSELEEYGSKYDQSMLLGKGRLDEMIPTDGYLKINGNTVPLFNNVDKNGALVSLKFDSTRSLVYSAKINLDAFNLTGNIVSIGFETGGYEMPQQDVSIPQTDVTQAIKELLLEIEQWAEAEQTHMVLILQEEALPKELPYAILPATINSLNLFAFGLKFN